MTLKIIKRLERNFCEGFKMYNISRNKMQNICNLLIFLTWMKAPN